MTPVEMTAEIRSCGFVERLNLGDHLSELQIERNKKKSAVQKKWMIVLSGVFLVIASLFTQNLYLNLITIALVIYIKPSLNFDFSVEAHKYSIRARTIVLDNICQNLGLVYCGHGGDDEHALFRNILYPEYNRETHIFVRDIIYGDSVSNKLKLFEVSVDDGADSHIFILKTKYRKKIDGLTLVAGDIGEISNLASKMFYTGSKIKLDSTEFNKSYYVYSTDQIESRYLITPDIMEILLEIKNTVGVFGVRIAFYQNEIIFAFKRDRSWFDLGQYNLDDQRFLLKLIEEFAFAIEIVSAIDLDKKTKI